MARISLRNMLGKNKDFSPVLLNLVSHLPGHAWIEDNEGALIFGNQDAEAEGSWPISAEESIIGFVKGTTQAGSAVAGLLNHMLQKEVEKKKLGSEVLSLYHEINVIFNFSEQLAQTIEPEAIARITLEQAMQSISSNAGVLVLWDENEKVLQIAAASGEPIFDPEALRKHPALLLKIGLSGQSEILADLEALKRLGIVQDSVQLLAYAAMKVKHRIMGAIILAGKTQDQFSAVHLKLLVTLSLQSSAAIESAMLYERNIREAREREEAILRIHEVTQRFVPHEFIKSLGKQTLTEVRLGDQAERIVTVLFTDIRDYTTLSEKLTPEENFAFVCAFNAKLGPIIKNNQGFVNQYQGDSIMAIFPNNPEDALRAAIEMQQAIHALNKERIAAGLTPIKTGIGMHTGPLIMGITGDENRMDATTISDTVNTAARIESLTKYYKTTLLLSEETYKRIGNSSQQYNYRHLGSVRLKGKRKLLTVFECIDGLEPSAYTQKYFNLPLFQEAITLYHNQQFEGAIQIFHQILETDPEDHTVALFLQNAQQFQQQGVPDNWTGVNEMMNK